jgi:hypothetical protein
VPFELIRHTQQQKILHVDPEVGIGIHEVKADISGDYRDNPSKHYCVSTCAVSEALHEQYYHHVEDDRLRRRLFQARPGVTCC